MIEKLKRRLYDEHLNDVNIQISDKIYFNGMEYEYKLIDGYLLVGQDFVIKQRNTFSFYMYSVDDKKNINLYKVLFMF